MSKILLQDFAHARIFRLAQNQVNYHLNYHRGCTNDFAEVAQELNLDLTSWCIIENESSSLHFCGEPISGAIYNMTADGVNRIWNLNKDYFNSFDAIITSDTAPLARIFLENGWQKPLIIWVCNRFDYYDRASSDGRFPDAAFYQMMRQATMQDNLTIISYTPYEYFYAAQRGVNFGPLTIKPIGTRPQPKGTDFKSAIPSHIKKKKHSLSLLDLIKIKLIIFSIFVHHWE